MGLSPAPILPTIPQAPLVIPDGEISSVRLATTTFICNLPRHREDLSVHPHASSQHRFVANLDTYVRLAPSTRHSVLMGCPRVPVMAESPFAPSRRYLSGSSVDRHFSQRYPAVIAHMDSCANPGSSASLRSSLAWQSLQVAVNPCCNQDLPDVILLIFPHVLGPLPRMPLRCIRSFLLSEHWPSPVS